MACNLIFRYQIPRSVLHFDKKHYYNIENVVDKSVRCRCYVTGIYYNKGKDVVAAYLRLISLNNLVYIITE